MPSSVVAHIDYNRDSLILTITFISGLVYAYKQVPEDVYKEMKSAPSKGIYLNTHIKGKYDFERIK